MKFLILIFLSTIVFAKTEIKNLTLIAKLDASIWGIEFINPEKIVATLKEGHLAFINLKDKSIKKIKFPLDVSFQVQGGLLDVELHPKFKENNKIYFSYAKKISNDVTSLALAMGEYKNDEILNLKDIFIADQKTNVPAHFGSRITFDDGGFLYLSTGDRYRSRDKAQQKKAHFGKVFRLMDNGEIPKDNPFKNAVFSFGHRNIQGLKWHPIRKILVASEHGPRGGDEINLIESGKNYGWPKVSHGMEYEVEKSVGVKHIDGMVDPIYTYIPSIAPCGLDFYEDKILIAALALTHINMVSFDSNNKIIKEERLLEDKEWRIRDIKVADDKKIFFSTDLGEIYSFSL